MAAFRRRPTHSPFTLMLVLFFFTKKTVCVENFMKLKGGGQPTQDLDASQLGGPDLRRGSGKLQYVRRSDDNYDGWGLHVWGGAKRTTEWTAPLPPQKKCRQNGAVFIVPGQGSINYCLHRGEEKADSGEGVIEVGQEIWLVEGETQVFHKRPRLEDLPKGSLGKQRAFWLASDVFAVPPAMLSGDGKAVKLYASRNATLRLSREGIENSDAAYELKQLEHGLSEDITRKFPHLKSFCALQLPAGADLRELLQCQLAVQVNDSSGRPVDSTGVQIAGAIDDLCFYEGALGVCLRESDVELVVWSPTAQEVNLLLYADASTAEQKQRLPMTRGSKGEWKAAGPRADWEGCYFLYELKVFCPWTNKVELVRSTDPYSHSLAANGLRTHIADLSSAAAVPQGWTEFSVPPAVHPVDMSIYELHVRDFSALDATVPEALRGTYAAFGCNRSEGGGSAHLASLAEAGLTHVHLLPAFDFGSVNERRSEWVQPRLDKLPEGVTSLAQLPPDSELQQEILVPTFNDDGFNWGYDPQHYSAPEGSYATDPDGLTRVREFRAMVVSLAAMNLRVVMDVVYNHVCASGPSSPNSVLDKVVPGYYLRRSLDGSIENSTCMNNTASEHAMFDRLIVDSVVHWAKQYKIAGFRFDLMGHIMLSTMKRIRAALDTLTLESDGINGKDIYLYGEGWEFGEVANSARGVTACQLQLAGTGLGSFNDRIREAVTGGNPFADPRLQGFATGLGTLHNGYKETAAPKHQSEELAKETDRLLAGLAGSISDYEIQTKGQRKAARDAGGKDTAYVSCPSEIVNYVSAHDNETLFDLMVYKLKSGQGPEEYARRSLLCSAFVAFAQGIPFFHAGDETLRSKSLDRDSYNSGDHYNALDWSLKTSNFGVGLPPKEKNGEKWDLIRPLLAAVDKIRPDSDLILRTSRVFKEFLRIRYSSSAFRLRSAEEIKTSVRFFNCGADSVPGVVVMQLLPRAAVTAEKFSMVVVVFNARPEGHVHREAALKEATADCSLVLHSVQKESADPATRTAEWTADGYPSVPAGTAAVFVATR
eukprot:TRINITY_DN24961_c0_g1_i1.p1 TRINITY_DN24961_c0_g1~~TRINITY_DN24961_c0_g1_i1.p1  ORF type:complete len:1048 (-),score=233.95 TRINITY_DN24961_c0_g1_i1:194-3337(-)